MLVDSVEDVRLSAGRALAAAMGLHPATAQETLDMIYQEFCEQVRLIM
jgi:hypothetical protein